MQELRAAVAIARRDLQNASRYRLVIPSWIFNPLYQSIVPGFLFGASFAVGGRQVGLERTLGTTDLSGFLFMGGIISSLSIIAFWWAAMTLRTDMDQGVLEPTWLTPTRRETVVFGRFLGALIIQIPIQAILFALGIAFFGLQLRAEMLLAIPAVLVATIALIGVSYMIAAMVLVAREANFLVDTIQFLFSMLSGLAFPITVLPGFAQVVAVVLPTTWAAEILRAHALGARTVVDLPLTYALLLLTTAVTVPLGLWAFRSADRWVRVHGTIAQH